MLQAGPLDVLEGGLEKAPAASKQGRLPVQRRLSSARCNSVHVLSSSQLVSSHWRSCLQKRRTVPGPARVRSGPGVWEEAALSVL